MRLTIASICVLSQLSKLLWAAKNDVPLQVGVTALVAEATMAQLATPTVSLGDQLLSELCHLSDLIADLAHTRALIFVGAIELRSI